jgi:hypothetical protein
VGDLQVAVDKHRFPRPEGGLVAGVGIGAIAIARTSTSACAGSPSTFRNTSPTRSVARWLWATTTSTSSIPAILAGTAADVAGFGRPGVRSGRRQS